jgi:hypothetical protein
MINRVTSEVAGLEQVDCCYLLTLNTKTMKTVAYIIVAIVFSGTLLTGSAYAQKGPMDPMSKGSWTLNIGIGPGIHYYSGYSAGFGPGFQIAFEKGMWQLGPGVLTLGGEFGLSYFHYKWKEGKNPYSYTWTSIITAARSAYHYGWQVRGLDTYGGFAMGLRFLVFNANYDNQDIYGYSPAPVNFFPGFFVGASYFFNRAVGINGEFGYNTTYAQIGVIFKLN